MTETMTPVDLRSQQDYLVAHEMNTVDSTRWRISPEEAGLRVKLMPESVKKELPPIVERSFEGNEDLREHIERILTLDRTTVKDMLSALKDRQLKNPQDEELRKNITECLQFVRAMGIDTDKPIPETTKADREKLPLSPLENMDIGKSWESITFHQAYTQRGEVRTEDGIIAEVNMSFRTWWDRNRDLIVPKDDTAKRAVDYEQIRFKQQMSSFMESYFAYQTNGLADSPATITIRLGHDQVESIQNYLRTTGRLPEDQTLARKDGLTLARNDFADMKAANDALHMDDFSKLPKMGFWHGWGGNRMIGNMISTLNQNYAFVSFDAMGSAGNRIMGKMAGLRNPNQMFSLEDYARNQEYVRNAMFREGDVIRGWSMGAEALAISLVNAMRELEGQLGEKLTPERIDELLQAGKIKRILHIAEARATADRETGITSCDFLRPNPLEDRIKQLKSLQSSTLIQLGHALHAVGIAGLPVVGDIVGRITDFQGGLLLKHDTSSKKGVLDIHTDNLNSANENKNIALQTDAILNYKGMTQEDMRLLVLGKYLHPVLEITGKHDLLTDEKVQQMVNEREAQVARSIGCEPSPIISMHDDHSLMAGTDYMSFPFEAVKNIPPELFQRCIEVLRIQAKVASGAAIELSARERIIYEHCMEDFVQPDVTKLIQVARGEAVSNRPLHDRIQQRKIDKLTAPDMISGFINTMVSSDKRAAVSTLLGYLTRQDIVLSTNKKMTTTQATPLIKS